MIRLRIVAERLRAQALRMRFEGVQVDSRARLARGAKVDVAPGGRLELGPCAVAEGVLIEVGAGGHVRLDADFVGRHSVIVSRSSVSVGAGSMVAEMCILRDSDHARDNSGLIHAVEHRSAPVQVGRHCWLGARTTVLKGVTMGDGATAGAGSVITHDVGAGRVVVGVPAREVGLSG
jgi:acetyltransferase-like isoleucine patch superfamily enzyme